MQTLITCHQPWNHRSNFSDGEILDREIRERLEHAGIGIAERALLISQVYGNKFSIDFWTLAITRLNAMKALLSDSDQATAPAVLEGEGDETSKDEEAQTHSTSPKHLDHSTSHSHCLESNFDVFCDSNTFQEMEVSRVQLQDSKKYGTDTRLECARKYILLGKSDRAIHLLLESDTESSSFYSDSLRACLLATDRSSGTSQSTVKLVATSLIAHGKLSEGIELLCLINKSLDACRYLQTYGEWNDAIWLAKVTLTQEEASEVVSRWISDYLCSPSVNDKERALLAALSFGDLMKVIELLYSMQCFSLSALFIESCMEQQLLKKTDKNISIIEAVFLQYARVLDSVGVKDGACHYARQAGEQGEQLLTELKESAN